MPISLLLALLIAFGLDLPGSPPWPQSATLILLETAGAIALMAALAIGLGGWVAAQVARLGYVSGRVCRIYGIGSRLLTILGLAMYAGILYLAGWSELALSKWRLQGLVLVDDVAVFLPYLVIQLVIWLGLYPAERALHDERRYPLLRVYLALKVRQAFGLVLPVILIFIVRQDVFARFWPDWQRNSVAEPLELAGLGVLVLLVSPLFIRVAWPTRSMPQGPLRRRLERVARRVGFRFTDLLVWDTGHLMVNACVTGVLPWFRYVLLTDALVDTLSPAEAAAVFGHEVGHVAHRHLPFFGFFFLGSLGALSLAGRFVSISDAWIQGLPWVSPGQASQVSDLLEAALMLGCLGMFFWLVFGYLSRRFERQADVFGCRVVSCGERECPPHFDLEDGRLELGPRIVPGLPLCPVGIQIFADALTTVARQNGIDAASRSWRHGSIASRLAFLQRLQLNPAGERVFQRGVRSLRLALSAFLIVTLVVAVTMRSWELLQ
jgi:STE24 endopeptidase